MIKSTIAILAFSVAFLFAGPVSYYGELKASGNKLIGSKTGNPVQVKGVSLGWSNSTWESARFFNKTTVDAMIDGWKAEVIRTPYGQDDASNLARVKVAIDAALAKDVYVVIDWHSHNAHSQTAAATKFFSQMARDYGDKDNVIFEIYNEPTAENSGNWTNIKNYANTVVDTIRKYSDNLIIVGTPNWCQDIDVVASSPITGNNRGNIAYVLHFYAHSHNLTLGRSAGTNKVFRTAVLEVLNANLPVFVSEYGTTHSDGGCYPTQYNNCQNNYNTHNAANSDAWHAFMDENKISSVAWNINDKYEGSAFFGTVNGGTFTQTAANFTNQNMMTNSGKYIFGKLADWALTAEWRNPPPVSILSKPVAVSNMFVVNNSVVVQAFDAAELKIFNLRGSLLRKVNLEKGSHTVSLSDMPKGVYIAKISINNQMQVLNVPIK
ncbi:MAG: cellulase family glycosylhydrolase [Fibromonadales bacterium]|nr:cellulase family glycosylhydrolase [Fibromonadales bacterium]